MQLKQNTAYLLKKETYSETEILLHTQLWHYDTQKNTTSEQLQETAVDEMVYSVKSVCKKIRLVWE